MRHCVAVTIAAMLLAAVVGGGKLMSMPSAAVGLTLSEADARLITGGDTPCGNQWISGTKPCSGGTRLCPPAPGTSVACSTVTFASLVKNGPGDETPSSSSTNTCVVCGGMTCGTATSITGTDPDPDCGT